MAPAADWHLVLARDGTVPAATDGAPRSWIGTRLAECTEAPEDAKEAGRMLLGEAYESVPPVVATVPRQSVQKTLHLTVVEALPLRRTPTDLGALLQSTLEVMRRQAHALDVTLNTVVENQIPGLVSLDADKIAWTVTALVGNALRYVRRGSQMTPGGSITVHAAYNSAIPEIMIEVQDDGSGISAERLPFLFSRGQNQPRVGLGLLMVRDIMAAHGGHVEVESETAAFDRGTTVRLTLPVS